MTPVNTVTHLAASGSALTDAEPGVLGFLVVAALGLALFFLLRSMNKHLRKVAAMAEAESAAGEAGQSPDGGTVAADGAVKTGEARQDEAAKRS